MSTPLIESITEYIQDTICLFNESRITRLKKLNLQQIIKRKNPYLYIVKNLNNATDIVKEILDAHIISSEEGKFGDWLEGLAIFVNQKVYGGYKSSAIGIDLEFANDGVRYLVSIKSGPNWGNASQVKNMIRNFEAAKRTLATSNSREIVVAVNGCCYGKGDKTIKSGNYYKYCGQDFWEFISGVPGLYLDIIESFSKYSYVLHNQYRSEYHDLLNTLTYQFIHEFCDKDGIVDWHKIVSLNSSAK